MYAPLVSGKIRRSAVGIAVPLTFASPLHALAERRHSAGSDSNSVETTPQPVINRKTQNVTSWTHSLKRTGYARS